MKVLENRGLCIVLMIVLIAAGILIGGYKGLSGEYQKAADVFFLGEDGDGICIANDMAERANALTNMQTIAAKYLKQSDKALKTANDAVNAYAKADGDIAEMFEANVKMDTAMEALVQETEAKALSAKDESYVQRLYADFNSRNDTISHDPYYTYAAEYNEILRGFPAGLIKTLTPVKAAPIHY